MKQKQFNDSPIQPTDKGSILAFDTIENNNFAESLAAFIHKCETPMTIGLQGDWGTGKTSLMNLIKYHLPDKSVHKIDINTWHYSMFRQDEYLGIIIIKSLVELVAAKFIEKENSVVSSALSKLGGLISRAINIGKAVEIGVPFVGGISINDANEAIKQGSNTLDIENLSEVLITFKEEFRKLIQTHVTQKNERIFFFVDDLDRVKPVKAVEILESLKNFMDVEGCVFVLAVDYEIVQIGITEKFGKDIQRTTGKSFFDKIIQMPFVMPTASYNIKNYIKALLQGGQDEGNTGINGFYNYDFETNDDDLEFFVNITEVTIGRNPRSIKRAINYATLLETIRAKNATNKEKKDRNTTKLLYSVVCMQIAWPELFNFFVLRPTADTVRKLEDWDYLDNLPPAKKMFSRLTDIDEVKGNISGFFDQLYSILDTNKDGVIKDKKDNIGNNQVDELLPLRQVLKLVKLMSPILIDLTSPQDEFFCLLKKNASAASDSSMTIFFDQILVNSYFYTSGSITYKKSGSAYITIICNRKQIGSFVSLKTRPFIFRVKESSVNLLRMFEDPLDRKKLGEIIKDLENPATTSGIGDTEIDCNQLVSLNNPKLAIELLNKIFLALTKLH